MAYYNKVGLLVLNPEGTKFLVCQKTPEHVTKEYILPGGKIETGETEVACLEREIQEELNSKVAVDSLEFVGEYSGIASGYADRDVNIRLYKGKISGAPSPSTEIQAFFWIGKEDIENPNVSPILKTQVIPDLLKKQILK